MEYSCNFACGQWNAKDFITVGSPRWPQSGRWRQLADCIANDVPETPAPGQDYASMLLETPLNGGAWISTRCMFMERMAPLIVLSPDASPVYGDHLEIVLYDCGLNLWHHYLKDGQPSWQLLGFLPFRTEAGKPYDLSAQLIFTRRGPFLQFGCSGHEGVIRLDTEWPETYFAGITACEGNNRFYSFAVRSGQKPSPETLDRFPAGSTR